MFVERKNGFTMIELVVMFAIITIVSAVVLVSFTGLNEGAALNRSARELALSIRKAQNMALAVTQISGVSGSPPVGVRVSSNAGESDRFFLFTDSNPQDWIYNASASPSEKVADTEMIFLRGVRVTSLRGNSGSIAGGIAHVIFSPPEATITMTRNSGATIGDFLEITLTAPAGQTRKIEVRVSGQVSIK